MLHVPLATLALSLLVGTLGAAAAPPPRDVQSALDARIAGLPGMGVIAAVVDAGGIIVRSAGATGTSAALGDRTVFEIGSVTKTFTATLLATMVLDRSVSLDDPVQRYMPENVHVPTLGGKAITLLDLATQYSGLPRLPTNLEPTDADDPYADYDAARLFAFLNGYTLTREPGAAFEYSNLGFGLLGFALSRRAGMSYADLVRTRILEPLGMHDTAIVLDGAQTARFAQGHDADGEPVKPWHLDALAGAGALRSTVADLARFARCNLGVGPLAQACLFAQQPRRPIPGNQIGLAWWTDDTTHIIHHGGTTAGFQAALAVAPDHSRAAIVLSNGGLGVEDVAAHVLDPSVTIAQNAPRMTLPPATLDAYAGDYAMTGDLTGTNMSIVRDGDRLRARLSSQPAATVYPEGTDRFAFHVVNASLAFSRDSAGHVVGLILSQNGREIAGTRPGATEAAVLAGAPKRAVVELPVADLDAYVGTYAGGGNLTFVVTRAGSELYVKFADQPPYPVFASARDHFFYRVVAAQIDFIRDASGRVVALDLQQMGRTLHASRVPPPR